MQYEEKFTKLLFSIKDSNDDYLYKSKDIIFDFKSLPPENPLSVYTTFIYKQLNHTNEKFNIERYKFELFLLKDYTANAFAASLCETNIICINIGLLNILSYDIKKFVDNLPISIKAIFTCTEKIPILKV